MSKPHTSTPARTWGWFLTVLGAVQVVTAIGVFRASEAAGGGFSAGVSPRGARGPG
jgi:hypothetical protein